MKIGRNDPCPCGSGRKYKHCCYDKDHAPREDHVVIPAPERAEPADEAAGEPGEASKPKKSRAVREEERRRFRGDRTKGGSYNPRVFRGSQRGT